MKIWFLIVSDQPDKHPPPLLTGPNLAPFGEESKNMIGQRKRNVSKINSEREQLRLFGTRSPIGVV